MNKLPSNNLNNYVLTTDWKIDELIKELNKRSIEFSLGMDGVTKDTAVSFNIYHRKQDKDLIKALLKALFGTVRQV